MVTLLPALSNIQVLNTTLFRDNKSYLRSFYFRKLRHIRLMLLEISFHSLIELITTAPFLTKLKLTGLINPEGYVINHQWINLFYLCPSIDVVRVNLSLEEATNNFRKEAIQAALYKINLRLRCLDEEYDSCISEPTYQRWWKLSALLNRHHLLGK